MARQEAGRKEGGMNMKGVSILFWAAAAYDGLFGAAFFLAPETLYSLFGVTPPNHYGYVRFPAALLVIFGLMFAAIALKPVANRNLVPYGILLKVAYCGVTFGYWIVEGIPGMWKPFAVADLIFAILFVAAFMRIPAPGKE